MHCKLCYRVWFCIKVCFPSDLRWHTLPYPSWSLLFVFPRHHLCKTLVSLSHVSRDSKNIYPYYKHWRSGMPDLCGMRSLTVSSGVRSEPSNNIAFLLAKRLFKASWQWNLITTSYIDILKTGLFSVSQIFRGGNNHDGIYSGDWTWFWKAVVIFQGQLLSGSLWRTYQQQRSSRQQPCKGP